MRFGRSALVIVAVGVGLAASARLTLWAQDRDEPAGRPAADAAARIVAISAQDALLRPFDFPFAEPTSLLDACSAIGRALNIAVALDRAALDRQDVTDDDAVKLDLKNVRLKVGLKLLLDPLHLTFRVVPEDNLLIITDAEGSEDPALQSLAELKALHREMHDLQDAVDDLRALVEEELGFEPEGEPNRTSVVGTHSVRRSSKPRATSRPVSARAHERRDGR
jgi:hypothetical protein